jgi:dTDP-4-dehydrorhamnose reductase
MNERLILFGASGLIGHYLFEELSKERVVTGTYCSNKKQGLVHFNFLTSNLEEIQLQGVKHAIICSAMTKIDTCSENPQLSNEVNVEKTKKLITELSKRSIVPVFFSSASVFDGKEGGYKEADTKNPINLYGKQKASIEDFLEDKNIEHLIIRPGKVFGIKRREGVLFTNWIESYLKGEEILCADDEQLSPTYVVDIANGTKELIDSNARGIYHLNFPKHMSRYEMAINFFKYLNIRDPKLIRCSIDNFHPLEKVPKNTFLDSSKFVRGTGFKFTPLETCYNKIRKHSIPS